MAWIWAAFSMGLVGSLHCVGMCGPLMLAVPYSATQKMNILLEVFTYQLGRILVYALLGAMIGWVGKGLYLAGLQSFFSVATGVILLIAVFLSFDLENFITRLPFMEKLNTLVKSRVNALWKKQGSGFHLKIGMLNGLLPCGLVYLAIAGAVTMPNILTSTLYMTSFGLGTLPLLVLTILAGQRLSLSWRSRLQRLYPLFVAAVGLFLIVRGLEFDVPRTFDFWQLSQGDVPVCH